MVSAKSESVPARELTTARIQSQPETKVWMGVTAIRREIRMPWVEVSDVVFLTCAGGGSGGG